MLAGVLSGAALAGCAVAPPYVETVRRAPTPSTEVYAYPAKGQSEDQQKRDRYECYQWASQKTGVEPSALPADHVERSVAVRRPNGEGTAVMAVTGALIGAAVSNPRNAGAGAAIGAVVGAIAGAAAESAQQVDAARVEQLQSQRFDGQQTRLAQQVGDYRRAMSACLEGRGYRVQ